MNKIKALVLVLPLLVLCSCGVTPPPKITLYWPSPPDKPRIKYVEYWYTEENFGRSALESFSEYLAGKEVALKLHEEFA